MYFQHIWSDLDAVLYRRFPQKLTEFCEFHASQFVEILCKSAAYNAVEHWSAQARADIFGHKEVTCTCIL
jgi:hypothetical protein